MCFHSCEATSLVEGVQKNPLKKIQLRKRQRMRLIIRDTHEKATDWVAVYIKYKIDNFKPTDERPNFVLGTNEKACLTKGLPTGSTPLQVYKKLVEFHKNGKRLERSQREQESFRSRTWLHLTWYISSFYLFVRLTTQDEYVDLPEDHPQSYHSFMWENLFRHIDIIPSNVNLIFHLIKKRFTS